MAEPISALGHPTPPRSHTSGHVAPALAKQLALGVETRTRDLPHAKSEHTIIEATGRMASSRQAYLCCLEGCQRVHRSMAYRPVLPRLQYGCSKRPSYRLRRQSFLIEYDKGGSNCGMVS